jgi:hypothetical protein
MIIYEVVYYNQYGEKVADFGLYEDQLDAEERALEVRMKTPVDSGKVRVEELFVHDSSHKAKSQEEQKVEEKKDYVSVYDLKSHDE